MKYALELYVAQAGTDGVPDAAKRASREADRLSLEGTVVRFIRSIFLPGDETCFLVLESASRAAIEETARRAEIRFERIVEIEIEPEGVEWSEIH